MNKAGLGDFYSKKDFLEKIMLFGLSRQSPKLYGLESKGWENLRRVEKLLWFWDFSNKLFFNIQQNNKDKTRMYRFEDIFEKRDDSVIEDLLNFMTADEYRQEIKSIFIKKLGNKINTSLSRKNLWNFSDEDKELVCRQSKALMEIFKYIVV